MSGGTDSIHTIKGKDFLALLAKAWATPLLCRLTWEKEQVWNKPIKDLQSFTMCPILDQSGQSPTNAFTTSYKSPSKMACLKPNSSIKWITLKIVSKFINIKYTTYQSWVIPCLTSWHKFQKTSLLYHLEYERVTWWDNYRTYLAKGF